MNLAKSTISRTWTARRTSPAQSAYSPISMRSLPALAVTLVATMSLAACKRGDKPALGTTDTAGARADTMAAPGALSDIPKNGGDTIAVPPAAVDTTTNRPAGVPSSTGASNKAVGVDTPITHRMGSPAVKKP